MARVPRHFRDKLVSSQTGVNSLDTSGADTARAVTQMAGQFQQIAAGVRAKKQDELMKSTGAKAKAEYRNQYNRAARTIQQDFAHDPVAGREALDKASGDIKDQVLGGISNDKLRSDLGPVLDSDQAAFSVNSTNWEIGQLDTLDRQFLVDVQKMNIEAIVEGATEEEYDIMLGDDTFTEENYIAKFGPVEGPKNYQTSVDAMFRARAMTLLENNRFFDAQEFIQQREEPSESTRKDVEDKFLKTQKGAEAQRFFQTTSSAAVDALETQMGFVADEISISELDDKTLNAAVIANETTNPEEKKILTEYAEMLGDIRDMKMERVLLSAQGNTQAEARLQAIYDRLFTKKDGQPIEVNSNAYMEDVFGFLKQVVNEAKAGDVSASKYKKWMWWSRVALQGVNLDDKKKEGGFLGIGAKETLSRQFTRDNTLRQAVEQFINKSAGKKSTAWRMGVLEEVFMLSPSENVEQMTPEALTGLFTIAERRANAREAGYSIDIVENKVATTSMGTFPVEFDQDNEPVVNISTVNMER